MSITSQKVSFSWVSALFTVQDYDGSQLWAIITSQDALRINGIGFLLHVSWL